MHSVAKINALLLLLLFFFLAHPLPVPLLVLVVHFGLFKTASLDISNLIAYFLARNEMSALWLLRVFIMNNYSYIFDKTLCITTIQPAVKAVAEPTKFID